MIPARCLRDFLEATRTRINYFRAMAGVPSDVTFNDENNKEAQATALIMSRPERHGPTARPFPPPDWKCWTQLGHDGAALSNLAVGNTGPPAIDQLMRDSGKLIRDGGKDTGAVGHRRTILNPQNISMGSGSVPATDQGSAAEAQLMVSNPSDIQRPARDGFVAWPPPASCRIRPSTPAGRSSCEAPTSPMPP